VGEGKKECASFSAASIEKMAEGKAPHFSILFCSFLLAHSNFFATGMSRAQSDQFRIPNEQIIAFRRMVSATADGRFANMGRDSKAIKVPLYFPLSSPAVVRWNAILKILKWPRPETYWIWL
jgi:hypothetical protein